MFHILQKINWLSDSDKFNIANQNIQGDFTEEMIK